MSYDDVNDYWDERYGPAPGPQDSHYVTRLKSIAAERLAARQTYDDRMAELDAEIERVERRLALAEAMSWEDDPFPDGATLLVRMNFTATPDKTYTYACLRAGGRWYTTSTRRSGMTSAGLTWAHFLEWLTKDGRNVESVYVLRLENKIFG